MIKILLVDDSNIITETLKRGLQDSYKILTANNGDDGYNKANDTNIDLFIIDYNMPIMNGLELTKKLRLNRRYYKTPIIILTMESSVQVRTEAKKAGANGWIAKPCDIEKLKKIISNLIA